LRNLSFDWIKDLEESYNLVKFSEKIPEGTPGLELLGDV